MHNKCNALESSRDLPLPPSVEKLSSTKPVPDVTKVVFTAVNYPFIMAVGKNLAVADKISMYLCFDRQSHF